MRNGSVDAFLQPGLRVHAPSVHNCAHPSVQFWNKQPSRNKLWWRKKAFHSIYQQEITREIYVVLRDFFFFFGRWWRIFVTRSHFATTWRKEEGGLAHKQWGKHVLVHLIKLKKNTWKRSQFETCIYTRYCSYWKEKRRNYLQANSNILALPKDAISSSRARTSCFRHSKLR